MRPPDAATPGLPVSFARGEATVLAWIRRFSTVVDEPEYTLLYHPDTRSFYLNRACRLQAPPTAAAISAIETACAARGRRGAVSLGPAADAAGWGAVLLERGYRLTGHLRLMGRRAGGEAPGPVPFERRDLTVRPAPGSAAFAAVWREVFGDDSARLVPAMPGELFVAEGDGEVVGAAGLFCDAEVALLYGIATRPPWWRRGVARTLVRTLVAKAYERGAAWAVLQAEAGPAVALYTSESFSEVGVELCFVQ